ncbi:phosphoglycerate mutase [Erysipelotrichaceae bacterium]|nr:phosphoglycerate mutase [Erysipelotrichaceae bacterium]
MAKRTLYFMRHGQTNFNLNNIVQGWCDSFLTEQGIAGVGAAGVGILDSGIVFDGIYSSDSGRTQQTARVILEKTQSDSRIQLEPNFREFNFGGFEGQDDLIMQSALANHANIAVEDVNIVLNSMEKMITAITTVHNEIFETGFIGEVETHQKYTNRLRKGLENTITAMVAKDQTCTLIVSHGMTICTLVQLLEPGIEMPKTGIANASLTKILYDDETGQYTVESVGQTA